MPHPAAAHKSFSDRTSLYQEITDKIVAELEAGPRALGPALGHGAAKASLAMPKNAATKRRYSGINVLILWRAVIDRGFAGQSWLTFRQALGLGGHVRKGERGTTVVYADRFVPERRTPPRRTRRRRARGDPVPQALHGVQHRPMRGSSRRSHDRRRRRCRKA